MLKKLISLCFKLTDLSIKYSCNFNVLIDGIEPKQIGIIEILSNFLEHRKVTIKRKSKFNIEKIKKRLEILKGYQIVFKNLNSIIKIIRTKDNPKKELIKKYKLSDLQCESILSMRLGSLRKIDEKNIKDEIQKLNEELKYLNKLIKDKKTLDKFIVSELDLIKNDLDSDIKDRKSLISSEQNNDIDISIDEFKEIEKFTIIINKDFQLKRIKEITDEKEIEKIKKENLFSVNLNSNQKILLFVSSGKVYTIDPNNLPGGNSNPKSFIYFVDSMPNDKVTGLLSSIDEELLIVSKNAKGFISNTESLVTNQKKGKQLFNLKNNDVVIKVLNLTKKHIACVTKLQKMLIFEIDALPKLQKGGGVQLIKIKKDDFLSDVTQLTIEDGLEWSTGSKNRKLDDVEFWIGKRAQAGKKVPKFFNKNQKFDG